VYWLIAASPQLNPRAWLPEADLSNLRLHPASHHDIEIEQPEGRTDKRGQFVLPVSPPEQNADALCEQAQAAEETGDDIEAERLMVATAGIDDRPPGACRAALRRTGLSVERSRARACRCRYRPARLLGRIPQSITDQDCPRQGRFGGS
jgi:hypothetical protein